MEKFRTLFISLSLFTVHTVGAGTVNISTGEWSLFYPPDERSVVRSNSDNGIQDRVVPEFFGGSVDLVFPLDGRFRIVDVHYRVNEGPQLDYRMDLWQGEYHRFIDGLSTGDIVDYYYTYRRVDSSSTMSLEGGRFVVGEDLNDIDDSEPPEPPVEDETDSEGASLSERITM